MSASRCFFALHGTGIVVGQLVNRRMIPIFGTVPAMLVASGILILSAALMVLFSLVGWISAYLMTAMLILLFSQLGYLVVYSIRVRARLLDPHGEIAGFARHSPSSAW